VQDEEEEEEDDELTREPTAADLDAEARGLLQWPELSAQVRAFTATTLGMRACTPSLELGNTPEDSLTLLAETTAAATLQRSVTGFAREVFEGTRDVRAFVVGANNGRVLNGSSLADVATTAAACTRVHSHVSETNDADDDDADAYLAPLRALAEPLADIPPGLEPEIRRCLALPGGAVGLVQVASSATQALTSNNP
jgi:DNA mismatch repair protein MutS2